jgi:predicted enzyme related to lactoylglutathione lyase
MNIKHNVIGWFEIPVRGMDRAVKFYETFFGFKLSRHQMGPADMAWFPIIDNRMGAAGSLTSDKDAHRPSADGVLICFTAFSGDLSVELSRVEVAGGKVLESKQLISDEAGYMGIFLDSEGNRIALHSRK